MRAPSLGLFLFFVAACGGEAGSSGSGTPSGQGGTGTSTTGGDGGTSTVTGSQTSSGGGGAAGAGGFTASGGSTAGSGGSAAGSGGSTAGAGGTTTSTSNTGSGSMLGDPCSWGDDCGGTLYCEAPGCAAGTCQPRPPQAGLSPTPDPVCGCDGITYWSPDVAASKGQSIAAQGACQMPIVCDPNMPCPQGMKCSRLVADAASCSPDATGECWATALSCPLDGPNARACTTGTCELQCSLIQSENPWYEDPTCL